jgi:outer membrane murein-binding lipoprotein Lpp
MNWNKMVIVFILLVAVLVAGGFYILYLESKITKLYSEIAGLKLQINVLLQKKDVATQE